MMVKNGVLGIFRGLPAMFVPVVLCLALGGPPLGAQPFLRALTSLRVLRTVYFDIIYPEESEGTALRLAEFADRDYEDLSSRLGISVGRRIPVTITPHIDEFNSFMNSMPYPHILLLDTPMSPEWTSFDDPLEKLFLHELTHAVSLSTRSGVLNFFHKIFGGWIYPPAFNAPPFMIEGAAVSFESLDGYGRAGDPLFRQKLRQHSYEGKFLSPHQVSRVSDMNAASEGSWYDYGGLFSRHLQETYGMEKYAELWRTLGSGFHFSFSFYKNGFYHYFEKVYGLSLPAAWTAFERSLKISNIEDSEGLIVSRGLPRKPKNAVSKITGMASAGNRIFVLDSSGRHLFVYNTEQEETELVIPIGTSAYDLTASAGGDSLLVSAYQYRNNRAEAVVTEFSTLDGRTGRTWRGLYRAAFFRDGVVGIAPEGHRGHLVFRPANPGGTGDSSNEEVLLRGGEDTIFSNLRPLDETWIAFTAARKGKRELGFYNYDTKRAYTAATGLPDDGERWEFHRYLQVCGDKLLFAYNHDDRMYKLGLIDLGGGFDGGGNAGEGAPPSVLFTGRDFSGAVALPVLAGDAVYYRGSFFATDRLMRYPEKPGDMGGISAELRLRPWDPGDSNDDNNGIRSNAAAPALPLAAGQDPASLPAQDLGGPYLPFKYLNPLNLWLPFPLVRLDPKAPLGFRPEGVGIYSLMIDPPENNTISFQAAMNIRFSMVDYSITWTNSDLGVPVELQLSDEVSADAVFYRNFRANIQSTFSRSLGSRGLRGFGGVGFGYARFYTREIGDSYSAYTWGFHSNSYKFMGRLGLSSLTTMPWETFGQGYSAQTVGWLLPSDRRLGGPGVYPRVDALFQAAFEPVLPLRLSLYGAWDSYPEGMDLHGQSSQHPSPVFLPLAAQEYQNNDVTGLRWLTGAETEFRFFSLNIQRGFSHLYFNRLQGTLAYRLALYDATGFFAPQGNKLWGDLRLTQSLVLRLGGGVSSAVLTSAPFKVTAYLQTALKISAFSQASPGFTDLVTFSPSITLSY
jgi:hypothetical protein